jgi:hypothetical protein
MRYTKLLLLAMVVAGGPSLASAQELRPVANTEQLGFSSARLQRLTDTYQGYVEFAGVALQTDIPRIPSSCEATIAPLGGLGNG